MANKIKAFQAYSPRVKINRMKEVDDVVKYISGRSNLNESVLHLALLELKASLEFYLKQGYSVRLPGLGSFAPTIDRNGKVGMNQRPDKVLISELNVLGATTFTVRNKNMIGKSDEEFIQRWNNEHPEDPIE